MTQYTEENILTLDWKEHIRMRPGMYIGKLGDGSTPDARVCRQREEHPRGRLDKREHDQKPRAVDERHPNGNWRRNQGAADVQLPN